MNEGEKLLGTFVIFVVIGVTILASIAGYYDGVHRTRMEAIGRNLGEWVVFDKAGNTKWQWKGDKKEL